MSTFLDMEADEDRRRRQYKDVSDEEDLSSDSDESDSGSVGPGGYISEGLPLTTQHRGTKRVLSQRCRRECQPATFGEEHIFQTAEICKHPHSPLCKRTSAKSIIQDSKKVPADLQDNNDLRAPNRLKPNRSDLQNNSAQHLVRAPNHLKSNRSGDKNFPSQ